MAAPLIGLPTAPQAMRPPWVSALSLNRVPPGCRGTICAAAAAQAFGITSAPTFDCHVTQKIMNTVPRKAPQAPERVLHCQNRVSAATQSSFSISFSQSRLKRSCGNTAITLPIVGNLTSRGICLFKPAGKINAQPDWSGRRKRIFWHYLTNLQRTVVGVAAK